MNYIYSRPISSYTCGMYDPHASNFCEFQTVKL